MITKNYYDRVFYVMNNVNVSRGSSTLTGIDGTSVSSITNVYDFGRGNNPIYNLMNSKVNTANFKAKGTSSCYGFMFGTGNVAPTEDDLTFSGEVIPSANIATTQAFSYAIETPHYAITCTYTITNNGSEPITIGEIGLVDYFYYNTAQYGTSYYYPVLVERTALESPITIAPGGVGQVTYTIDQNYSFA